MIERFWQLQKLINQATDNNNQELIDKYGDEQDECIKQMSDDEFNQILKEKLPNAYKNYIINLRR